MPPRRGWTTLTLCRLLVVPLPPPPFSSLGGFIPAQSSRNALPSSSKMEFTSLWNGLIFEISFIPPVEYPFEDGDTRLFDIVRPEVPREPYRLFPGGWISPYLEPGMFSGLEEREPADSPHMPEPPWNGLPMCPGRVVVASDCDRLRVRSCVYDRPRSCEGGRYRSSYVSDIPSDSSSSNVGNMRVSRIAEEKCAWVLAEKEELRVGTDWGIGRAFGFNPEEVRC